MSWDAIGAIGELLGAAAVFCSLLYLALQIRQNSKNVRSQSLYEQAAQSQRISEIYSQPHIAEVMVLVWGENAKEISPVQYVYLETYLTSLIALYVSQFRIHEEKLGNDWDFIGQSEVIVETFRPDMVKAWWQASGRKSYPASFVSYVDELIGQETHDA